MLRRPPVWLVVLATAALAAVLTITVDRAVGALWAREQPVPPAVPSAPERTYIVVIETPEPATEPTPLPADEQEAMLRQMQQQQARTLGYTFVNKALLQLQYADEALDVNERERANDELDAARASLDEAARLLPEELKPQLDSERFEIGRIRANLDIDPRGLDEELRRMRERLLGLIAPRVE